MGNSAAAEPNQVKTCVITGGTSGLGRATALALGRMGWRVILVGRNERAGKAVCAELKGGPGAGSAEFLAADLAEPQKVRRLAREVGQAAKTVDVLINNAGARFDHYRATSQGVERTFAVNHLGHFLLTALLLDRLLDAPQGRVITVSSGVHASVEARGEWNVQEANYNRKAAYAGSKLANVFFAYELARRLEGTPVTSNAVDPGGVATHLGRNNGLTAWLRHLAYYLLKGELQSARRASETIVYLASSPEVRSVTGKYWCKMKESASSAASHDREAAAGLWELSVQFTGLDARLGKAWEYFGSLS